MRIAKPKPTKTAPAKAMGVVLNLNEPNIYEDTDTITKAIEDIAKGVVTLDQQLQHVLTGISVQLVCKSEPIHGVKLANDLLKAPGKGVIRNRRVIWWLTTYSPLKYTKNDAGGVFELKGTTSKGNLDEMRAEFKNWRTFVKKRNSSPYSSEEFKAAKDTSQEFQL